MIVLRFGLEDGHPRTLEEVGKEFNVTRERIRQIEAKALRKLRNPVRSKRIRDFLVSFGYRVNGTLCGPPVGRPPFFAFQKCSRRRKMTPQPGKTEAAVTKRRGGERMERDDKKRPGRRCGPSGAEAQLPAGAGQGDRGSGAGRQKPRLLLHSCCAPCSSYVLEYLSRYFTITLFYFNPNIYPPQEYQERIGEQERLIREMECAGALGIPVEFQGGGV